MKYLYGLSIQKIQSFIFETAKLKEIIGASQLVEDICTERFKQFVGMSYKPENSIITAAGKIYYIFEERTDCERVVLYYIRELLCEIPGLKVVQAVVEFDGNLQQEDINLLERRLDIQKNKPMAAHGLGLMVSERSRRTGGAGIKTEKGNLNRLDRKQTAKLNAEEQNPSGLLRLLLEEGEQYNAYDNRNIENLLSGREKSWIAVVHADGNNLGKTIRSLTDKIEGEQLPGALRNFSANLDKATKAAAKKAFEEVIRPTLKKEGEEKGKQHIPIRPIILGGDDLTVIVRGDLALGFTEVYLRYFEQFTRQYLMELSLIYGLEATLKNGLTACAGIAYIKASYPLHYGINLAESLCKHAKKIMKADNALRSCLSFHRVMSSFSEEYNTIVEGELKVKENFYLDFGPYFLERQPAFGYESIQQLRDWAAAINKENAPKAPIRNWLTELKINEDNAWQLMNRIKKLNGKFVDSLGLEQAIVVRGENSEKHSSTHLFDVITISNI
jgi:hypothetical protein